MLKLVQLSPSLFSAPAVLAQPGALEVGSVSVCVVDFCRALIGRILECYIVEEVIELDELNKGNCFSRKTKLG